MKTDMNEQEVQQTVEELSEEPIMPDDYKEGDDFFALSHDKDEDDFFADEKDELEGLGDDDEDKPKDDKPEKEGEPTTAGQTSEDPKKDDEPDEKDKEEPPTTETPDTTQTETESTKPSKLKFKARVDHQDVDAEIDESELPTLYQKAAATDRYQAKLNKVSPMMERLERMAKALGYEGPDEMLDAQEQYERESAIERLTANGAPKELAEDYVQRKLGFSAPSAGKSEEPPEEEEEPEGTDAGSTREEKTEQQKPAGRDFAAEVRELWSLRPDLRGTKIPPEVAEAAANGKNLSLAYFAYEAKQSKDEADKLRKENNIYKQNAEAAAKAPVRGVTGGGSTDTRPKDPFLEGFDSDW